jgi:hypothetical protein
MDQVTVTFWLSILGAVTATILAILKGIEFYRAQRLSFCVSVRLTGSEEVGNAIVLLNKSSIPATISYFDLAWVERRSLFGWPIPFTRKVLRDWSPVFPPDSYDKTIAPHGTHHLSFTENDHFDWSWKLRQDIYLRLWLIGRNSPIWIWITGPQK